MLDLSLAEILLIVVVGVVFIGPQDVPVIAKAVAKALRAMKSLTGEVKNAIDEISRESGLTEAHETIQAEMRMIQGDDGKMYEAYSMPDIIQTEEKKDEQR